MSLKRKDRCARGFDSSDEIMHEVILTAEITTTCGYSANIFVAQRPEVCMTLGKRLTLAAGQAARKPVTQRDPGARQRPREPGGIFGGGGRNWGGFLCPRGMQSTAVIFNGLCVY